MRFLDGSVLIITNLRGLIAGHIDTCDTLGRKHADRKSKKRFHPQFLSQCCCCTIKKSDQIIV